MNLFDFYPTALETANQVLWVLDVDIRINSINPLKIAKCTSDFCFLDWEISREPQSIRKLIQLAIAFAQGDITRYEMLWNIAQDRQFHYVLRQLFGDLYHGTISD